MSELVHYEDEELAREMQYRRHHREVYAAGGYPYEHYERAYRYGHSVGQAWDDPEHDWMLVETEAQEGWEALYDEPWPDVEEAVREGWRRALEQA